MSKARRREEAIKRRQRSRARMMALVGAVVLIVVASLSLLYMGMQGDAQRPGAEARQAALASEHAPTMGDPGARVHIVEFLDPACGTCALFYPMVKSWLEEAPDKLKLSVRHIAFHDGAEYAIRILEASRNQDMYWETLATLLATQRQWVTNHVVQADRILPAIATVGLDEELLLADMNSAEITGRIERDRQDAIALRVSATPEYFVNGRPLPSFGRQQLLDLVREEMDRAY